MPAGSSGGKKKREREGREEVREVMRPKASNIFGTYMGPKSSNIFGALIGTKASNIFGAHILNGDTSPDKPLIPRYFGTVRRSLSYHP